MLVVQDGRAVVADNGIDLVFVDAANAPAGERLYLGRDEEAAYFAVGADLPRRLGTRPGGAART